MKLRIFLGAFGLCLILITVLLLSSVVFVSLPSVADFAAQVIGPNKLDKIVQILY